MSLTFLPDELAQAKAILQDAHLKMGTNHNTKERIATLKLCKAREENIDFELGLAMRICGDISAYPYRSSHFLTKFFQNLGFDYTHDGSTRKIWVKNVLLQLNTEQITYLIQNGLFAKNAFKNPGFRTNDTQDLPDDDFLKDAIIDFARFIDDSLRFNETIDLDQILDLNVNIELLFDQKPKTKDEALNNLIIEAKERFLKPNDQNVAIEKLWDAFERIKTYYNRDKKKSTKRLITQMSTDLDEDLLEKEFESLTKIGNTYRIRHHETDKKPISTSNQINYLFFRMLSLIDLALDSLKISDI